MRTCLYRARRGERSSGNKHGRPAEAPGAQVRTDDLVPEDTRRLLDLDLAVKQVQVGAAHGAGVHSDQ